MTDLSDQILQALAGKAKVKILSGTFVAATATMLTVDCGNGRIPCFPLIPYLPFVGEAVYVLFVDDVPYVAGPTLVKPNEGTVVSVASGLVTLSTAFGNFVLPYTTTITPTAGQTMYILWQGGQGFAVSVMSAVPAGGSPAIAPPTQGVGVGHTDTFFAVDSGSYQGGSWWTKENWISSNNVCAWFYGTKIADTIPAGAVAGSIQIYISPKQIKFSAPNFGLHAYTSRPGGAPSFGSLTSTPIAPGWVSLPNSFIAALKSGGGQFGIGGSNAASYDILSSLAEDGASGALKISSTY